MAKKGLRQGAKFNRRHQTVIPDAEPFLAFAKILVEITKISTGVIEPCRVGQRRVKVSQMDHALKVQVRGVNAVQTFFLYGADLGKAEKLIREEFQVV